MKFERSGCTTCGLEIPSADSAARWNIIVYGIGASAVARRKAMCVASSSESASLPERLVTTLKRCQKNRLCSSWPMRGVLQDGVFLPMVEPNTGQPTDNLYIPVGLRSLLCAHKAVFILDC